jgi:hypothetical protein
VELHADSPGELQVESRVFAIRSSPIGRARLSVKVSAMRNHGLLRTVMRFEFAGAGEMLPQKVQHDKHQLGNAIPLPMREPLGCVG